jgi:hypothetical protein
VPVLCEGTRRVTRRRAVFAVRSGNCTNICRDTRTMKARRKRTTRAPAGSGVALGQRKPALRGSLCVPAPDQACGIAIEVEAHLRLQVGFKALALHHPLQPGTKSGQKVPVSSGLARRVPAITDATWFHFSVSDWKTGACRLLSGDRISPCDCCQIRPIHW